MCPGTSNNQRCLLLLKANDMGGTPCLLLQYAFEACEALPL